MQRCHTPSTPELVTLKETAELLGCSLSNVYALVHAGELPVVCTGRCKGYRVEVRDLDAFIGSRKLRYQRPVPKVPPRPLKHIRR